MPKQWSEMTKKEKLDHLYECVQAADARMKQIYLDGAQKQVDRLNSRIDAIEKSGKKKPAKR